jgi:hypothetical protein
VIHINTSGMAAMQARLARLGSSAPVVVAKALTQTAQDVRKHLQDTMKAVFDRPTPYTQNALYIKPASQSSLSARVWVKDPPRGQHYLLPQIKGGTRDHKKLEAVLRGSGALPTGWFAMPAKAAKFDAYGNMARSQITQIISQLRVARSGSRLRNMARGSGTERRQIAAQRSAGGRFFVIRPGQSTTQPGVYQREFAGRGITPVLIFTQRSPQYASIFDYAGRAQAIAPSRFAVHMRYWLQRSGV